MKFDLRLLELLSHSVWQFAGQDFHTFREARTWAFGEQGCVLDGETTEQAEAKGRKLLADL